jgi:predicted nucleotidyltransferase
MRADLEKYVTSDTDNLWDFDVFEDVNFMNANRIHPLKQREINAIIEKIKDNNHVIGLVIFGSATEFRCNSRSDIDMFVIRDDSCAELEADIYEMQSEHDIFFNKNVGSRLLNILQQHGVLVYERE